jgi:hypothetical protein
MPTPAQSAFFKKLAEEKDFGPKLKVTELVEQFDDLDDSSASAWIERALQLPKVSGSGKVTTPPAF